MILLLLFLCFAAHTDHLAGLTHLDHVFGNVSRVVHSTELKCLLSKLALVRLGVIAKDVTSSLNIISLVRLSGVLRLVVFDLHLDVGVKGRGGRIISVAFVNLVGLK